LISQDFEPKTGIHFSAILLRPGQPKRESGFRDGFGHRNLSDRFALIVRFSKEEIMDKEHVKGAADKAKGAIKDAAGKMMDDKKLQAEGKMDKAKGEARQALGDAKDSLKHVRNEH
jgi:uncharacterized protein YjbJ (UPF0337 family)